MFNLFFWPLLLLSDFSKSALFKSVSNYVNSLLSLLKLNASSSFSFKFCLSDSLESCLESCLDAFLDCLESFLSFESKTLSELR